MSSSLFPLGPHCAVANEVCLGVILFLKRIAVIVSAKIPVGLARDGIYTKSVFSRNYAVKIDPEIVFSRRLLSFISFILSFVSSSHLVQLPAASDLFSV